MRIGQPTRTHPQAPDMRLSRTPSLCQGAATKLYPWRSGQHAPQEHSVLVRSCSTVMVLQRLPGRARKRRASSVERPEASSAGVTAADQAHSPWAKPSYPFPLPYEMTDSYPYGPSERFHTSVASTQRK